ncbi:MAG: DHH family phosphoesterase [Phycisphaerales bacterium]
MSTPTASPSASTAPAAGRAADEAWGSTRTLDEVASALRALKRVAVLTHARPDGDAVGSTLAVSRTLRRIGVEAWPVYMGLWSPRFDAVVGNTPVIHAHHHAWKDEPLASIQHVLILDTGSWNQLADARTWLEPRCPSAIVVDHHAHGDASVAPARYVDVKSAAACEIAAELCCKLLGVASAAKLPQDVAEPLMLGLSTDTGWFRHSSTSAHVLRLAGDLVEAGARHNWLYQTVEQGDEPTRLKLIARALGSLEFLEQNRVAMVTVTTSDLRDSGGSLDDAGGLTDLPMCVGAVRVAVSVVEVEPTLTKVSFRSKAGGLDIDVNALAQTLGGGGHRHAAGVKMHMPLREALEKVRHAVALAFSSGGVTP